MLAVAEMYIKGVSTREAEAVMRQFGIESLSSSQVSRATKMLDEDLKAWRNRPLGEKQTNGKIPDPSPLVCFHLFSRRLLASLTLSGCRQTQSSS